MKNLVACVVLPIAVEKEFDYKVPDGVNLVAGMRVLVDFNGRPKLGIVTDLKSKSAIQTLKPVVKVLDRKPIFTPEHFNFVEALRQLYPYSTGEFLYMMLPKFFKKNAACMDIALDSGERSLGQEMIFVKADTFIERYKFWKEDISSALLGGSVLICFPQYDSLMAAAALIRKDFPGKVRVLHGYQKDSEMAQEWQQSRSQSIILGTRVAFWYYPSDLKLLIIEEENSPYYFQEEKPYHRIFDVALALTRIKKNKIIVAANYPTVNTYKLITQGKIIVRQDKQALSSSARIRLLDVAEHFRSGILSPLIVELLRKNIEQGKQSVLIINKIGYGHSLTCTVCGYVLQCQHCSSFLKLDHARNQVFCSYCSKRAAFVHSCPRCKNGTLTSSGTGIEKIQINLKRIFPGVAIASYGAHVSDTRVILATSKLLSSLYKGEKFDTGFVLDVDRYLAREDYDAGIKAFMYLKTLALVFRENLFVVTKNSSHSFYQSLSDDWNLFYTHELSERKTMQLPPFYGLARIELRSTSEELLYKKATGLYNNLCAQGLEAYGPFQKHPFRQRDKFHLYLLVKAKQVSLLRKTIQDAVKDIREKKVKTAVIFE